MTNENRISMLVRDEDAAKRISASHEKAKRNPTIERVEGGFLVWWDARPVKKAAAK